MPDLFSPAALRKSVHDSLDKAQLAIPPGKHGAVLVDATTDGGAQVLLVHRIGDAWTVMGQADYTGHHVAGKVSIAGSW